MRAPVIVGSAVQKDMQKKGNGQCEGHSLYEAGGVLSVAPLLSPPRLTVLRYSILPAISLDGIISSEIIEGSFTKLTFATFIDGLLYHMNPYPGKNSVIVMDNCRIHKSELIKEIIEER
jgi:hypothetical protein